MRGCTPKPIGTLDGDLFRAAQTCKRRMDEKSGGVPLWILWHSASGDLFFCPIDGAAAIGVITLHPELEIARFTRYVRFYDKPGDVAKRRVETCMVDVLRELEFAAQSYRMVA